MSIILGIVRANSFSTFLICWFKFSGTSFGLTFLQKVRRLCTSSAPLRAAL